MKPKYIETPEKMWELFEAYKKDVKENPRKVEDYVGKDAVRVDRDKERPLTMSGFEAYLCVNKVITDVSDYFENKEDRYTEYIPICRAIKTIIRADQIDGGMTNVYNPSITQRLNGLTDKQEIKHDTPSEIVVNVVKGKRKK